MSEARRQKLEKLTKAANALREAARSLREIQQDKQRDHYLCEESGHYAGEIEIILHDENGEGGIDELIRIVERESKMKHREQVKK